MAAIGIVDYFKYLSNTSVKYMFQISVKYICQIHVSDIWKIHLSNTCVKYLENTSVKYMCQISGKYICQIHVSNTCIHAIHGSSLRLKTVTYREKKVFRNNYFPQPCLMSYYFIKIFVHLSVTAAVCYFSVNKLIEWDAANFYLFKANSENTRKWYEICPKLTINTIESPFGVFAANFEVFLLLTLNR